MHALEQPSLSLTAGDRRDMASDMCSCFASLLENAALGSASVTGVDSVPKTAHVAFCGNYDWLHSLNYPIGARSTLSLKALLVEGESH